MVVFCSQFWESVPEEYRMKAEKTFACESDSDVDSGQLQFRGEGAALNVQAEIVPTRFQLLLRGGKQLT